jgi:hypothetical protein
MTDEKVMLRRLFHPSAFILHPLIERLQCPDRPPEGGSL